MKCDDDYFSGRYKLIYTCMHMTITITTLARNWRCKLAASLALIRSCVISLLRYGTNCVTREYDVYKLNFGNKVRS